MKDDHVLLEIVFFLRVRAIYEYTKKIRLTVNSQHIIVCWLESEHTSENERMGDKKKGTTT